MDEIFGLDFTAVNFGISLNPNDILLNTKFND